MPKKKSNIVLILLLLILIIIISTIINVVKLFSKPIETTIVKNGKLTKYEEVTGYIIRNEEIVDTTEYTGVAQAKVEDSTRVSKNGTIATYVSESEGQLVERINDLDKKIEEAMASQQTIYSPDAKALESSIQIQLYDTIQNNNDINSLQDSKAKLNNTIRKKAQIVGELSPVGSKLKELISERNSYEKQINDSTKELKAPISGLVSYRVDGYENLLTKDNISNLTSAELNALQLNANQVIIRNTSKIKIINNFECYVAMFMDSPESKEANLNDRLYLRFENVDSNLIPATIEYISDEGDGRLIFAKIETNIEELAKYRKINLDVVWWTYEGLKLHKSLITKKPVTNVSGDVITTLDSVKIKKVGFDETAYIKIVKEFDNYVIVDNYTTQDYLDMGFTEQDIANFVTLKLYSEVLVDNDG
ncbi:MAG: hypothetical protein IJ220_02450 [Clostridia bacterium]|nr:hypothetical protein [Clostridia bacterium]